MTTGTARFLVGDVFERMAELPDGSIDLVLTSPPFLALRSYLPPDHPNKAKEIGGEASPAEFVDTLLRLTAEWRRLLAPHGSIAVELGDTYSGSGGVGGDYNEGGLREGQQRWSGSASKRARLGVGDDYRPARAGRQKPKNNRANQPDAGPRTGPGRTTSERPDWPLDKSLCGIPHLYHLSLAYGMNILTGEPSPAGHWRIRNVVAWCRPNPPVGALGDKYRPATSYMTIATVARDRYFDLDAVRIENTRVDERPLSPAAWAEDHPGGRPSAKGGGDKTRVRIEQNPNGAPPLDWWEIATSPYAGAHYATWPTALLTRPIRSMVPRRVCTICGQPSRRIVEVEHEPNRSTNGPQSAERKHIDGGSPGFEQRADRIAETVGWTDCGCEGFGRWRHGVVLDPFAGSGTTLLVATGEGHEAIGIDLDERNAELARERVGMFLDVELPAVPA